MTIAPPTSCIAIICSLSPLHPYRDLIIKEFSADKLRAFGLNLSTSVVGNAQEDAASEGILRPWRWSIPQPSPKSPAGADQHTTIAVYAVFNGQKRRLTAGTEVFFLPYPFDQHDAPAEHLQQQINEEVTGQWKNPWDPFSPPSEPDTDHDRPAHNTLAYASTLPAPLPQRLNLSLCFLVRQDIADSADLLIAAPRIELKNQVLLEPTGDPVELSGQTVTATTSGAGSSSPSPPSVHGWQYTHPGGPDVWAYILPLTKQDLSLPSDDPHTLVKLRDYFVDPDTHDDQHAWEGHDWAARLEATVVALFDLPRLLIETLRSSKTLVDPKDVPRDGFFQLVLSTLRDTVGVGVRPGADGKSLLDQVIARALRKASARADGRVELKEKDIPWAGPLRTVLEAYDGLVVYDEGLLLRSWADLLAGLFPADDIKAPQGDGSLDEWLRRLDRVHALVNSADSARAVVRAQWIAALEPPPGGVDRDSALQALDDLLADVDPRPQLARANLGPPPPLSPGNVSLRNEDFLWSLALRTEAPTDSDSEKKKLAARLTLVLQEYARQRLSGVGVQANSRPPRIPQRGTVADVHKAQDAYEAIRTELMAHIAEQVERAVHQLLPTRDQADWRPTSAPHPVSLQVDRVAADTQGEPDLLRQFAGVGVLMRRLSSDKPSSAELDQIPWWPLNMAKVCMGVSGDVVVAQSALVPLRISYQNELRQSLILYDNKPLAAASPDDLPTKSGDGDALMTVDHPDSLDTVEARLHYLPVDSGCAGHRLVNLRFGANLEFLVFLIGNNGALPRLLNDNPAVAPAVAPALTSWHPAKLRDASKGLTLAYKDIESHLRKVHYLRRVPIGEPRLGTGGAPPDGSSPVDVNRGQPEGISPLVKEFVVKAPLDEIDRALGYFEDARTGAGTLRLGDRRWEITLGAVDLADVRDEKVTVTVDASTTASLITPPANTAANTSTNTAANTPPTSAPPTNTPPTTLGWQVRRTDVDRFDVTLLVDGEALGAAAPVTVAARKPVDLRMTFLPGPGGKPARLVLCWRTADDPVWKQLVRRERTAFAWKTSVRVRVEMTQPAVSVAPPRRLRFLPPVARVGDEPSPQESSRLSPLILSDKQAASFSLRLPATSLEVWARWHSVLKANEDIHVTVRTMHLWRTATNNRRDSDERAERNKKKEDFLDASIDDPATRRDDSFDAPDTQPAGVFVVELLPIRASATETLKQYVPVNRLPPPSTSTDEEKDLSGRFEHHAQSAPVPVLIQRNDGGNTAPKPLVQVNGGIQVNVPAGEIWELRVSTLIPKTWFEGATARFPSSARQGCQLHLATDGAPFEAYAFSPWRLLIEVATRALPSPESLWRALIVRFTGREIVAELDRTRVPDDQARLFDNLGQIDLWRQVWSWDGRPIDLVDGEGSGAHDEDGKPYGTGEVPPPSGPIGGETQGIAWEGIAFGDRSDQDHAESCTVHRLERRDDRNDGLGYPELPDAPRDLPPVTLYRKDLSAEPRALYYRFAIVAHSRYGDQVKPVESRLMFSGGGSTRWRSFVVPYRRVAELPVPAVRWLIPLTRRHSSAQGGAEQAADVLVVLSESFFDVGGHVEKLVCEVVKVDHGQEKFQQFGPDPILAMPDYDAPPDVSLELRGPIGHTFDRKSDDAATFVTTSFILRPGPSSRDIMAWSFAKVRFRREIVQDGVTLSPEDPPSAFLSQWTDARWVQFLPDSTPLSVACNELVWSQQPADTAVSGQDASATSHLYSFEAHEDGKPVQWPPSSDRRCYWALLTRSITEATGRADQEVFVALAAVNHADQTPTDPPSDFVARLPDDHLKDKLHLRLLEVQSHAPGAKVSAGWDQLLPTGKDSVDRDVSARILRVSSPNTVTLTPRRDS